MFPPRLSESLSNEVIEMIVRMPTMTSNQYKPRSKTTYRCGAECVVIEGVRYGIIRGLGYIRTWLALEIKHVIIAIKHLSHTTHS